MPAPLTTRTARLAAQQGAAAPPASLALGPARFIERAGGRLLVEPLERPGEQVAAEMALPVPYEPAPGDLLLVVGQAERCYVIGVLSGAGLSRLAVAGDLELHALGGTLRLTGDQGVKVTGAEVVVAADSVTTFARSVTEKASEVFRWAKERLTVRAGQAHRVVDGEDTTRAKKVVTLAEDVVKIDAHSVQLGH